MSTSRPSSTRSRRSTRSPPTPTCRPRDSARSAKSTRRSTRSTSAAAFPQDPYTQLELAIEAVFKSWNAPRAVSYRRINNISGLVGTAVNVQTMVFGNMGDDSGTGVAFTRDPSTGDNALLRRVPDQRAGRGRRRRHPHAGARVEDAEVEQESPPAAPRDQEDAREALPGHAGHRVHDRARHALHAADAYRQADRRGGR